MLSLSQILSISVFSARVEILEERVSVKTRSIKILVFIVYGFSDLFLEKIIVDPIVDMFGTPPHKCFLDPPLADKSTARKNVPVERESSKMARQREQLFEMKVSDLTIVQLPAGLTFQGLSVMPGIEEIEVIISVFTDIRSKTRQNYPLTSKKSPHRNFGSGRNWALSIPGPPSCATPRPLLRYKNSGGLRKRGPFHVRCALSRDC